MTEDMDKIALEGQIKNIQTLIELDEEDIKGYTEDLATQNITEGPYYDETMEIIREKKIHVDGLYKKLEILKDETLSSQERMIRSLRVS
ncbi:hypothetical protein EQO05_05870 [Methanosarcina sp. MSH10X1]|uniref:hypothetical protein n=1 Tax=Methanosarcina sp. MSH10X1 TaxID=2507075 RepID=UPI000FFCBC43|nr:hypothetical protein [Methanosarcina sp. MSH10X1]RXA20117.1 hypothetical protein EQO05_05870 [Methanosarcina sp. MSH10X1]